MTFFNTTQLMLQIDQLPPGCERDAVAEMGVIAQICRKELMEALHFADQIGSQENRKCHLIHVYKEAEKDENLIVMDEVRKRLDQIS